MMRGIHSIVNITRWSVVASILFTTALDGMQTAPKNNKRKSPGIGVTVGMGTVPQRDIRDVLRAARAQVMMSLFIGLQVHYDDITVSEMTAATNLKASLVERLEAMSEDLNAAVKNNDEIQVFADIVCALVIVYCANSTLIGLPPEDIAPETSRILQQLSDVDVACTGVVPEALCSIEVAEQLLAVNKSILLSLLPLFPFFPEVPDEVHQELDAIIEFCENYRSMFKKIGNQLKGAKELGIDCNGLYAFDLFLNDRVIRDKQMQKALEHLYGKERYDQLLDHFKTPWMRAQSTLEHLAVIVSKCTHVTYSHVSQQLVNCACTKQEAAMADKSDQSKQRYDRIVATMA